MRNEDSFGYGVGNEAYASYEQLSDPVLNYEALESFDTETPIGTPSSASNENYPNEVEHQAAARVLGLGYSIQGMRNSKLSSQGQDYV